METLEKIFGGVDKVKTMRLFLFNPQTSFDISDIAHRTKITNARARTETKNLEKIGLIKRRIISKGVSGLKKRTGAKKKVQGWILDEKFTFLNSLQNFLINITSAQYQEIVEKLKKVGSVKLIILSGVFIQDNESRVDILIVGDKIKKGTLLHVISDIESHVGKEIKYTSFETPDFLYRLGICDKLVRDILYYPHKKVLNKLE